MTLSSGFIFGEHIPDECAPSSEVIIFENGVFNPQYVPSGFNFANNRYTVVTEPEITDSSYNYDQAVFDDFENGVYADHLDDGTTFVIKTPNSSNEDLTLNSSTGYLEWEYLESSVTSSQYNTTIKQTFIIPTINLGSNNYRVYIRYRALSNFTLSSYISLNAKERTSQTTAEGVDPYHFFKRINSWEHIYCTTQYSDGHADYIDICIEALMNYQWQDYYHNEHYDYGDVPFKVEISKIWVVTE